jgi:hypothetical protein
MNFSIIHALIIDWMSAGQIDSFFLFMAFLLLCAFELF